jgi:hypothetical protein
LKREASAAGKKALSYPDAADGHTTVNGAPISSHFFGGFP